MDVLGFTTWLQPLIGVSIAASIGSSIAMIYHFQSIPVFGIISNILIAGVLGWTLFASVGYFCLSIFGSWILYLWGWTIYIPTVYIVKIGEFFQD